MDKRVGWGLVGLGAAAVLGLGAYLVMGEKPPEEPDYEPVRRDGAFELRDYPALVVAETQVIAPREQALERGFQRLADYLFAKSRTGAKLPMTLPIISDPAGEAGGWRTRFVMPPTMGIDVLPLPGPGIALDLLDPQRVAAIRFAGRVDDGVLARREAELRYWIEDHGMTAAGAAVHAYYNAPFLPGALRRTEILIPVDHPARSGNRAAA